MEKILDLGRSNNKFFTLTCYECDTPSRELYQFKLPDGNLSEDCYCSKCFDHIQELEKDLKDHYWDCKCILCN